MTEMLTVPQIAQELAVSRMTVYRLVHDGELPALRIGRSIRIRRHDLNTYIEEAIQ